MCRDRALSDVRKSTNILENGWKTNSTYLNRSHEKECDSGDTWYGFASSAPVGAIYTTFKGSGTAALSYGSCEGYSSRYVKVFLNDKEISEVTGRARKDVIFDYEVGDKLTISEHGIWKLYSFSLDCN